MNKHEAYIRIAETIGTMSKAKKVKVGCILVKDDHIIAEGYNGTPRGWDNICEEDGKTKPEVIHAEMNALLKSAKHGTRVEGATAYITIPPCLNCAMSLEAAGIKKVYYSTAYKRDGIEYLEKRGILVKKS